MNIPEPDHHTWLTRSPGQSPAEVCQGDSKLQHSDAVSPGRSDQVQSPANPRESQDRWVDELSPFQARRRELLRAGGSPKTMALERLRERIRQQRLDMKTVAPEGSHPTLVTQRGCVTRKICRFIFGYADSPALREGCLSDTQTVKETQQRLGHRKKLLPSPSQRTNSDPYRTGGKRILSAKPCKPAVRGRGPAPRDSSRNHQKSTIKEKPSQTPVRISSPSWKTNFALNFPSTSPTLPKKSPSPSTYKPIRMLNTSHTPCKVHSHRSPSPTVSSARSPEGPQRRSAQEVREFMGLKERERRRRERQKKEEVQREEEKRRARVQEVLHKQRTALNRAKRRPQNLAQVDRAVGATDLGHRAEMSHSGKGIKTPERAWQGGGCSQVGQVSGVLGRGSDLGGGVRTMESRVQRVEALRQAAAALGTRMEEEAARLRVVAGLSLNPTPGLTGPIVGPEDQTKSTSISEDVLTTLEHSESLAEVGDTGNRPTSTTAENVYAMDSGVVVQESAVTKMRASEPLHTAQGAQTPIEGPHTTLDAVEQLLPLLEGRVTPQSEHSDISDNTDSTSKWSELSGFFGRPELLSRLSLAISQQSLREEELRARQHSALCRLREEALWEKTQAELAWLEHRRRCLRTGEKGALADIAMKQEEVVNRMRQEQAEIRHWQNLYRCGRQQRKLLLQHQREVVEIRRLAAQLVQDLQGQETAQQSQRWAEPRGTQPSPGKGRSQCMDSPEDTPPCSRDPPVPVQQGHKRYHALQLRSSWTGRPTGPAPACGPSPLAGHRPYCPRKGLEHHAEYQEQDISETRGNDLCLGCGWTCLTMQPGQTSVLLTQNVPKNPLDPVRDKAEESRPGGWRSDPLLEHEGVSQGSQAIGQDRNRPTAQPGAIADMEARVEHFEQGVSGKKTPEASRQHAEGTFFSKTDEGLRRLLSSEGVWTWGRRRATLAEMAPVEQDEVEGSGYPSSSSGHPQKGQPPPRESVHTEGRGRGEDDEDLTLSETITTPAVPLKCDYRTAFVSEGWSPTHHPPAAAEESGPLERVSKEEGESWSDESSSSGGPLRVRSLPNSAEASWKSQKSVCSFASLPEFQRAAAVCMNVSQLSNSSSDAELELPLDMEDSGWRGTGTGGSAEDQEKPTGSTHKACTTSVGKEPELSMGYTVALNVQNDWRSQGALPSNDNHEIMPSPYGTGVGDCPGVIKQAGTWPGREDSGRSPGPGSPGPDTESSSANYGLSETEEGSDSLSFSSEDLSSSEDDLDQTAPGTVAPTGKQRPCRHPSHLSGPAASSARCYEATLFSSSVPPEVRQPNPGTQVAGGELGMDKPGDFVSSWKPSGPEEALSEILSPVDEVLSYGSAELPPTIADDFILPSPPPACEIITWTSEEGFPPPPEELCKPQNEENPLEDPSIKSDDLPSLSEDVLLPAARVNRLGNDGDFLKVDQVTPGPEIKDYSIGQRSWGCQGNGEDNSPLFVTLSVAEEDEEEGSSDPLSSFYLGDRVLVCNSRPGQLRFKGPTCFANGCWAGVALDHPMGNHDGAFRGVRYFQCDKNCGVLVRAEDISHLIREQDSDQETRADDPFSDEEPPSGPKQPRDRRAGSTTKPSGSEAERGGCQKQGGHWGSSSAPQTCRDLSFPTEMNNNILQVPVPMCEAGVSAPECSSRRQEEAHHKAPPLQVGELEAEEKESCLITPDYRSAAIHFSEHLRGAGDTDILWVGRAPLGCLESLPEMRPNALPLLFLEQSISQSPGGCLGSLLGDRERGIQSALCVDQQIERAGPSSRCVYDLESLVEKLMGKLLMEVLKEAEEVKRRQRRKRSLITKENHIQNPALRNSERGQLRQSSNLRPSPLCFSDQWRCSLALATQTKVRVRPHDAGVVHRLVGASVETLWGRAGRSTADSTEAPAYLADEESRRAYRQVICDLTSEVFHEVLRDRGGASQSPWELKKTSSVSPVSSSETCLGNVKAVIQAEVQRELNLERTDVQTREKLRNLCKYGTVHRDRVDYILIQELHKEELQWVDYSLDQRNIKMQLSEEIFDIILQDTVSVLNHIYTVPSGVSPPTLQSPQCSLIP